MTNENKKSEVAKNEEKVLEFWNKSNTFKKSEEKNSEQDEFVFYDGPPFATGLPHYGHILAGTIKDAIPRYQTMQGKQVKRMWGWDCHGLPLENIIEEELGLGTKKDIEDYGIEKFNEVANSKVLRYADDWEKIIPRMGRWVDMSLPYRTMDTNYTESVWWSFKEIFEKGLIKEDFKSMHYCPRCGTTLSNFEVNQGYKDIKDLSVVAKFELEDESGTFLLAWTTTPWTLPGNMALAVNLKALYCKFKLEGEKNNYILAKERLAEIVKEKTYEILEEFSGSELLRKKYKPVFPAQSEPASGWDDSKGNRDNAYKIWGADFVTMEEGTGIVHIAPAFGEDDLNLAKKNNIPIIHHVDLEGRFKPEVKEFFGRLVKSKEDHQATDVEIIKYLAGKELLFAKEKIEHSYPHCWRCDTPLLNYATSSWFLTATKIKDKIIAENQKIHWVPENIRDGRFGKWLEGLRDWAISRSRYWGAPLPVWKCEDCKQLKVIGSVAEIKQELVSSNNYFVLRHGEADNNILNVCSKDVSDKHFLTEKGKKQITAVAQELKNQPQPIDVIITSPFARTKQSAKILADYLGVKEVIEDERLKEINVGEFGGQACEKYHSFFATEKEKWTKRPQGGENLPDLQKRVGEFIYEIDANHKDKNILLVTHEYIAWMLQTISSGLSQEDIVRNFSGVSIPNAKLFRLDFAPLPHNRAYQLDLHRPYIDEVTFPCRCGGKMEIIKEVFDCWYESGSMSYASKHYPFENLDIFDPKKERGYPADFIAEGLDQTRGWFYSMLVLSVALFDKRAYQNVIVNGLVLAEDGQKMSKSKKNFPDPLLVVNKYGADALRYYLLSSPLMKGEDLNFSEKGVDEVLKKNILRFKNILSFYRLYESEQTKKVVAQNSPNVLDRWIFSNFSKLIREVSQQMENYEIDKATRPLADFIDDFSTWYLRRSRDRFKGVNQEDKDWVIATTRYILENLAKVCAPFMPFISEEIWQAVTNYNFNDEDQSVHLESWPSLTEVDNSLLEEMRLVRYLVSLGLEARATAQVKVRQPLGLLTLKNKILQGKEDLLALIKAELNVKDIQFNGEMLDEVDLDLTITPELKEEGNLRELIRNLQGLRKEADLQPNDLIDLEVETDEKGRQLFDKFNSEIKTVAGIKTIKFSSAVAGVEVPIGDLFFKFKFIRK